MYEEYMQNFFDYPVRGYQNTYEQMGESYPYGFSNSNMGGVRYGMQGYMPYGLQNRNSVQNTDLESCYPEIYKIVYPMIKKACAVNNRAITAEVIDTMVDEIYSNLETNEGIELNITINNDVRGEAVEESERENRQRRRNNILSDLIRILLLRELIGRPGCVGPNCRPGNRPPRPNPWQRPPYCCL